MGRKGELSRGQLDRNWPHQVAIPATLVSANLELVHRRIKQLGAAPRSKDVVHQDRWHAVYCFATAEAAAAFKTEFDGMDVDPDDVGKGSSWNIWTPGKAAAKRAASRRY